MYANHILYVNPKMYANPIMNVKPYNIREPKSKLLCDNRLLHDNVNTRFSPSVFMLYFCEVQPLFSLHKLDIVSSHVSCFLYECMLIHCTLVT